MFSAIETKVLQVEGMACEHCVSAITKALSALDGVKKVNVSLSEKTAIVEYKPKKCTIENIITAIEEQGFDVKK